VQIAEYRLLNPFFAFCMLSAGGKTVDILSAGKSKIFDLIAKDMLLKDRDYKMLNNVTKG